MPVFLFRPNFYDRWFAVPNLLVDICLCSLGQDELQTYYTDSSINKNVSFQPQAGEKIVLDEDCSEDKLRSGILVLTNRRLVFQKTVGRIATFSKKEGEVVLDIPLADISSVKSEGFWVKKLVVSLKNAT